MSEQMNWAGKEPQAGEGPAKPKPVQDLPLNKKKQNWNMTPDEIKAKVEFFDQKFPNSVIRPIIQRSSPPGSNRVFIVKSLSMKEMRQVEETFADLFKNESELRRNKLIKSFMTENGFKDKEPDDLPIPEQERLNEMVMYRMREMHSKLMTDANDRAINMVAVAWPEDHKDDVSSEDALPGDIETIAVTVQVISGYSRAETDVEVYRRDLVEERAIAQGAAPIGAEEDGQSEAERKAYEHLDN